MRTFTRMLIFVALLLVFAPSVLAQPSIDPSGHWEGAVQIPNMELKIEIDLTKDSKGKFAGTFSIPAQNVKGLPISTVTIESQSVRLEVKAGPEVSTFAGVLSADGKSITGEASQGGHSAPFSLTRTGDARTVETPKSSAIGKELEGTWNGTLDVGERKLRLVLKMENQSDGTAKGSIVSLDGSGVEIAIAMKQKDSNLTIDVPSVGVSYAGVLNAEKTELVGTWTQGGATLPLTFRRAAATVDKK